MRSDTFPPVIFALLISNALAYVATHLLRMPVDGLALWPLGVNFAPWQPVTYAFLHANEIHLFFNMFALWMFGRQIEYVWGSQRFLIFYFVTVVGAAIAQLIVAAVQGGIYPTVGASGGVFGVLLAFGMLFPNQRVMLIFPPVILPAKYFVLIYGALELYFGVSGTSPGVAHFAHLGGMVFGWLLIVYWRRGRLPR
jgi:membrane associated rhomboid family serine protease